MVFNLDKILTEIGQFGLYQRLRFVAIGLSAIPVGYQTVIIVLIGAKTNFRCKDDVENGTHWSKSCLLVNSTTPCDNFEFDQSLFQSTIRSQWDLVCSQDYLVAMVQTIYMLGWLVGVVILGYISDRYGRKKVLVLSLMVLFVSSVAQSFDPNMASFMVLRCLSGAAAGGFMTSAFIVFVEMVGNKSRVFVGTWIQGWWAIGFMILAGVGYGVRDHRYIQLIGAIPLVACIYLWWILPESLRWLLSANRHNEVKLILNKIATVNGKAEPDFSNPDLNISEETTVCSTQTAHISDLFKTSNMRRITGIVTFNWFVVSLVYYGLTLSGGELGGDIFLNLFLSGVVEIPSYVLITLTVDRFGRIKMLALLNILGGVSCIVAALLMGKTSLVWLVITTAMIGKFAIAASFALIYIYSAEVFPTSIRNIGLGVGSMAARVGGLLAPQITRLDYIWSLLPYIIFAIFPIVAGLLDLLLPETKGHMLPSSVAQVHLFFRKSKKNKKQDIL